MKKILFCILILFPLTLCAQSGYRIHGEIRNGSGKMIRLSSVYGERLSLVDSAVADASGDFTIALKPALPVGLYRISLAKDDYFNLVLNNENIDFRTDTGSMIDSIRFLSSVENQLYYRFMKMDRKNQAKLEVLVPVLDYYPEKDAFYLSVAREFEAIQNNQFRTLDSLSSLYPNSFAVRIFRLQQGPFVKSDIGKEERMNWLKNHFLDKVNFNDTLLLRSDAWVNKAVSYLSLYSNNRLPQKQLEAEFIKAVTVMLSAASVNPDIFKFLLDYFVGGFDKYHFDEVITYLADNFQDPFACEDQARKTSLQKKLENFKKIAVGKTAPDIEVPDIKGKPVRLTGISSEYTLLMFWSSECGHCMQMMPKVKQLYDRQKPKRYEILAVSLDTSRNAWTAEIKNDKLNWLNVCELKGFNSKSADEYNIYATPTMFLLDRGKKILSKPTTYKELEQALRENNLLDH
jgi:thiol-disulfide isomerase/thioredoxin